MEGSGAIELERRAAAVDRLLEADRDASRSAARRLERIDGVRRVAEAANAPSAAVGGGPALDRENTSDARDRVRFRTSPEITRRSVRAEIAAALRISERAAETQLAMARSLVEELTATLSALREGAISEQSARILWEHAGRVPDEHRPEFEEQALKLARSLSPARLAGRLHALIERLNTEQSEERHREAAERRDVWVEPAADGMAYLTAFLPAANAIAALNRMEDTARGLHNDPNESRTLAQLRADQFADLLITGEPRSGRDIRASLQLIVPVLSLLGHSEELAILEGYGPIDLETARALTAHATSFTRILTHPVSGAVLDYDRSRYRPTDEQRDWLRLRDATCRFPGCGKKARHCELDHSDEWAADHGPTAFANLAHLCTGHHTLKTATGWTVRHLDRFGRLEWTSPLGRTHITEPALRMRGQPHLADAVRNATLDMDSPPDQPPDPLTDPPDPPDDVMAALAAELDADLEYEFAAALLLG